MPQVADYNRTNTRQNRASKIGLLLLFIVLALGLAIWLFWSIKKKEMYRKENPIPGNESIKQKPIGNSILGILFPTLSKN